MVKDQTKWVEITCNWCGEKKYIRLCHYRQSKSKTFYCGFSHEMKYRNKYHNPNTKETVSYSGLHKWIVRNFGKAKCCKNKKCLGKSNKYDWAFIKGKEYKKDIVNFTELCRSCHTSYDKKNKNYELAT